MGDVLLGRKLSDAVQQSQGLGGTGAGAAVALARLDAVDWLRGLVMVIMALDHTRDFYMPQAFDPTDLTRTYPELFFTRWITHFCAPVFVFLAGTGAFLSGARGRARGELARFLVTRGLWLIAVEITLVRFGFQMNWDLRFSFGQVIWAIGWSMIALAGLIYLPLKAIAAIGLAMVAMHNLLDGIQSNHPLWLVLHREGLVWLSKTVVFYVKYPLVPWIGVMACGYAFGALLLRPREQRAALLVRLGAALTAAFVVIRAINIYGDPAGWSVQKDAIFTVMSFLNCQKYPPSLLYLLMTLGPAILLLGVIERRPSVPGRPLIVFGRVPLFYYLLHLPLIHGSAILVSLIRHGKADFLMANPDFVARKFPEFPPDFGFGLPVVYAVWIAVVLALYPACAWFAEFKRRNRAVWLSYL